MFNTQEKQYILELAHRSIEHGFDNQEFLVVPKLELISEELLQERSCFVTLELDNNLRGCIGHIEPIQALYLDIIENAYNSAFNDSRFNKLNKEEFSRVEIEVSILTKPEQIKFIDWQDLLEKININQDGLIIKLNNKSATYLPQVWEQFSSKEEFLSSLCKKANLESEDWKKDGLEVFKYQVEVVK
jgi:uncharacterized protein